MKLVEFLDRSMFDRKEQFQLDLFYLSYYTNGLSLGALASLTWEDIEGDMLNCERFSYPLAYEMYITEEAWEIINKHKNRAYGDYVLPIYTHKHKTDAQKKGCVKRMSTRISTTLNKACRILCIDSPTIFSSARYSFIAHQFEKGVRPCDVYQFTGSASRCVEKYLYELEDPILRRERMLERQNMW
ncbi:hypothetical protein [uncultured Alistipes sp.]|uniref:hypothetical protein n=1 Tax=uncultured Alistipes sp. TaxID=538949 RepID=UPI0025FCD3B7|nr:hypothetical protein [uncultured Alistipes sp.]